MISNMTKQITLIRGPIVSTLNAFNNEATPAIGLAYIASYIKSRGYKKVKIVDAIGDALDKFTELKDYKGYQIQGLRFDEIIRKIPKNTEVIGISAMFSGEWPIVRDLIFKIRKTLPNVLIVAGGEHVTALPEFSLYDCSDLDICVVGEGEHTFYEILEAKYNDIDFNEVSGICFLDKSKQYISTGKQDRIRKIDAIPWPYWPKGYLEKFWNAGKSYGVASKRDMPILGSRGCPYQCTFCSNSLMWTTRYILRDIDDLISEIKYYQKKYDITALQFYDLTAITKKRWTVEFCNKLIDEKINLKWSLPSGTRSEALDEESLSLLNKTGCNYLVYAPESGSIETLTKIKKRIDLKKFTASVVEAKKQGLILRTNLIIGFPHETRKNVFQTILYGLRLALKGVDEVSINIFSPYPGTEIFDELYKGGEIVFNDNYFLQLTSLNSDYTEVNPFTVNKSLSPRELAIYRVIFMMLNYIIGYLTRPKRIIRTLKSIFTNQGTATVLEHRLRDVILRKKHKKDNFNKKAA